MQGDELVRVDNDLRRMCSGQGLVWLLETVDAAVEEGVAVFVNEGSSSYRRRGDSWTGFSFDPEPGRRSDPPLRIRAHTVQERVLLLLDAMLNVYRDLPELRAETLRVLGTGWEGRVPILSSGVLRRWPARRHGADVRFGSRDRGRRGSAATCRGSLDRSSSGSAAMTSHVDDLLIELRTAMAEVKTPFTRKDRADWIYEAYTFAQVIAATAECGGRVAYEDHWGTRSRISSSGEPREPCTHAPDSPTQC